MPDLESIHSLRKLQAVGEYVWGGNVYHDAHSEDTIVPADWDKVEEGMRALKHTRRGFKPTVVVVRKGSLDNREHAEVEYLTAIRNFTQFRTFLENTYRQQESQVLIYIVDGGKFQPPALLRD